MRNSEPLLLNPVPPVRLGRLSPLARAALPLCVLLAACGASEATRGPSRYEELMRYNLAAESLRPPAVIDSLLAAEQGLSRSERLGRWARRFLDDERSEYLFGLKEGGYVREGLLVSDHRQDCVSLLYRTSELARAFDHRDAISIALALRFPGAPIDSLIDGEGRVDYGRPEHLDYSLDMIRSGLWGRDVTATLPGALRDEAGTSRYPPGSYHYLPTASLPAALPELREGDVAWFALSPDHESARRLRDEYGLAIGHIGILIREAGELRLVHAASSSLPGEYEGGRVVSVPLSAYLPRIERFQGILVTRF